MGGGLAGPELAAAVAAAGGLGTLGLLPPAELREAIRLVRDASVNNEGMTGVLFFDGACGMCTRARDFLVRHDRTGNLETEPLQGAGVAERLGIPEDRLLEAMRWLDSSGAVYTGAEAWAAAWSVALGTHLPLVFYRVPGIRFLQNAVYRWVADHRYRFPGTTPYCESHPIAC